MGTRDPRYLLERYGRHHPDCYWLDEDNPEEGCNCGWAQTVEREGLNREPGTPPLNDVNLVLVEDPMGYKAEIWIYGRHGYAHVERQGPVMAVFAALRDLIWQEGKKRG